MAWNAMDWGWDGMLVIGMVGLKHSSGIDERVIHGNLGEKRMNEADMVQSCQDSDPDPGPVSDCDVSSRPLVACFKVWATMRLVLMLLRLEICP